MWIMNVVSESFPSKHIIHQRTLLKSARSFVLRRATCMLVFSIQKNVFVETTFLEKLHPSNLTVTWIAVETSFKSVVAETE